MTNGRNFATHRVQIDLPVILSVATGGYRIETRAKSFGRA